MAGDNNDEKGDSRSEAEDCNEKQNDRTIKNGLFDPKLAGICPYCKSRLKNQYKRHLGKCSHAKARNPSLRDLKVAQANMRGYHVDGTDFMCCPIKDCNDVLSHKNVARHFKRNHKECYTSASDNLKFKMMYVPMKKYFSLIDGYDDKNGATAIEKFHKGEDMETVCEAELEEEVPESVMSQTVSIEIECTGADEERTPTKAIHPHTIDNDDVPGASKLPLTFTNADDAANEPENHDRDAVTPTKTNLKSKRKNFLDNKITTPLFKDRVLLEAPPRLKEVLADFAESMLSSGNIKKTVTQKICNVERLFSYLMDMSGLSWDTIPYDGEVVGKIHEILERMPSNRRGAKEGEKLKTQARSIAVNSFVDFLKFMVKRKYPDSAVIEQTIKIIGDSDGKKRWVKSAKEDVMRHLRRDKDKLINLESFAKHLLEEEEPLQLIETIEKRINSDSKLTASERVKVRNRVFTDLLLLNPTRPGEACSLTVKDVLNAKQVTNRGRGSVLFQTYQVEEPDTDIFNRDFNYHKTFSNHGTKYMFSLKLTHQILTTYIVYLGKVAQAEGRELQPDKFILIDGTRGKNPEASSWSKEYFPGKVIIRLFFFLL